MKICITSKGDNLDSQVDPYFGRCKYFIIADTDNPDIEVVENTNVKFSGGVGIKSAQLMALKGVKALLTGNVGPNAFQTLKEAKIKVFTGISGKVKEAIEDYKEGKISETVNTSIKPKFGMSGM